MGRKIHLIPFLILFSISLIIMIGLIMIYVNLQDNGDDWDDPDWDDFGRIRLNLDKLVGGRKSGIYLTNQILEVTRGEMKAVIFVIQNINSEPSKFKYILEVFDSDIEKQCGIKREEAEDWIITGKDDVMYIDSRHKYYGLARFSIPETAPLCVIRFGFNITSDSREYDISFFDLSIKA